MTLPVTEVAPDLFCIQIPLPDKFLKTLNTYVVRSKDKSLIIDTGFDTPEALRIMAQGLDHIGVGLDRCDIFITHAHADHFGMVPRLMQPGTQVYFNGPEIFFLQTWQGLKSLAKRAFSNGFPMASAQGQSTASSFPQLDFDLSWLDRVKVVCQDSIMAYGQYKFRCIETPGHSPGHICLHEENKKLLVSGDHVLMEISPNIQAMDEKDNPLASYMESLKKVEILEVDLVLPAHRRRFTYLSGRVKELLSHHDQRLDELKTIINEKPMTAYEVAQEIEWDIQADCWENFPAAQKWFAMGEALSHMRFLEAKGELVRTMDQGVAKYGRISVNQS